MHETYKVCKNCFKIVKGKDQCCHFNSTIDIDKNIYPIIKELNRKGYETKFCCEGDVEKSELEDFSVVGYISSYISLGEDILKDKNTMKGLTPYLLNLPFPWYVDLEYILIRSTLIIRCKNNSDTFKDYYEKEAIKFNNLSILQHYIEDIPPRRLLKNKGLLENYIEELFEEEYIFNVDNSETMKEIQKSIDSLQEKIDSGEWRNTSEKFWV